MAWMVRVGRSEFGGGSLFGVLFSDGKFRRNGPLAFRAGEYKWKSEDADVHAKTLLLDPLGFLASKSRQNLPIQA